MDYEKEWQKLMRAKENFERMRRFEEMWKELMGYVDSIQSVNDDRFGEIKFLFGKKYNRNIGSAGTVKLIRDKMQSIEKEATDE